MRRTILTTVACGLLKPLRRALLPCLGLALWAPLQAAAMLAPAPVEAHPNAAPTPAAAPADVKTPPDQGLLTLQEHQAYLRGSVRAFSTLTVVLGVAALSLPSKPGSVPPPGMLAAGSGFFALMGLWDGWSLAKQSRDGPPRQAQGRLRLQAGPVLAQGRAPGLGVLARF
ncbi:MAG TPA: hypothetical protein VK842_08290 [bacterium]|nr:hypothetical protein [bacterium]